MFIMDLLLNTFRSFLQIINVDNKLLVLLNYLNSSKKSQEFKNKMVIKHFQNQIFNNYIRY